MDGFPSGQRGQTVNLLQIASVVRIHLHPFSFSGIFPKKKTYHIQHNIAGWSSLEARRAHNPKVVGSNPAPATRFKKFAKSELFSFLESNFFLVNSHLCLLVAKIKIIGTTNSFYLLSLNLFKN